MLAQPKRSVLFLLCFLIALSSCSTYKAAFNIYDDSALSEETSAVLYTKNYLKVYAYKKHGLGAAETGIGNLDIKTKLPEGRYRLEVHYDNPSGGRSFVPVSLTLVAEAKKKYWLAYELSFGGWKPYIANSEPEGFYGLLEFWRKE